jgi:predicted PurR-regulated permease PerM
MFRLNARWLALLAITLIALYLCWLIVAPFLDVILWAVVLAIIAYPYHLKLRHRGMGRNMAALVSTLGVCVVVLLPVAIVLTSLATQIPTKDELQDNLSHAKQLIAPGGRMHRWIDPYYDLDRFDDPQAFKDLVAPYTQRLVQGSLAIAGSLASSAVSICFALFSLFYFLRDNHAIGEAVIDSLPLEREQSKRVFERCQEIIQASVKGVLVIAAIQGALGGLGFWALGVKASILWGVIMFVMSLIPALGAFVVWLPVAIYLAATGEWGKALILAVWGGAVIGSIDNFLRPRLVGSKTGMHDLVIFFSVLGGLQVFGILGLFVGPVVVALAVSIVEVFKHASANPKPLGEPKREILLPGQATDAPEREATALVVPSAER